MSKKKVVKKLRPGAVVDGHREKNKGTFPGRWLVLAHLKEDSFLCKPLDKAAKTESKTRRPWFLSKSSVVGQAKVSAIKGFNLKLFVFLVQKGACAEQAMKFSDMPPQKASKLALREGKDAWYKRVIENFPAYRIRKTKKK